MSSGWYGSKWVGTTITRPHVTAPSINCWCNPIYDEGLIVHHDVDGPTDVQPRMSAYSWTWPGIEARPVP